MSLPPPINGTEQYLQAVHQELVGLRADLAADRAERIARAEVLASSQAKAPEPTEQLVELKEPAPILPVHAERQNLPPLSDDAGKAMARALDDGRPKARPAKPRRGDA